MSYLPDLMVYVKKQNKKPHHLWSSHVGGSWTSMWNEVVVTQPVRWVTWCVTAAWCCRPVSISLNGNPCEGSILCMYHVLVNNACLKQPNAMHLQSYNSVLLSFNTNKTDRCISQVTEVVTTLNMQWCLWCTFVQDVVYKRWGKKSMQNYSDNWMDPY